MKFPIAKAPEGLTAEEISQRSEFSKKLAEFSGKFLSARFFEQEDGSFRATAAYGNGGIAFLEGPDIETIIDEALRLDALSEDEFRAAMQAANKDSSIRTLETRADGPQR